MSIQIAKTDCAFEVEAFRAPFGFKGNYLSGQWQCAGLMRDAAGHEGLGVSVLSLLWSDAELFAGHPESVTGSMMYLMISHALKAVAEGFFFAKIKVGADPDKDGDYSKMLAWDQARLSAIHEKLKDRRIPWSEKGWIPYYLDANGRYDSKDRLRRLLDHADHIGALERIVIFEEPFPEAYTVEVGDLPVRIAADESAHAADDARHRIELGYGAIALKPIAKTMSMSLRIAKQPHEAGVPYFCADLTVCPLLVDWNKIVAGRLPALPGMKIGVLESNGHQNYREWARMASYHPAAGATWTTPHEGLFHLDAEFWRRSGGILEMPEHYRNLMK